MLLSSEELKQSSDMDPSIARYIEENPLPALNWSDYATVQRMVAAGERMTNEALGPVENDLTEHYVDFALSDSTPSRLKVARPTTLPSKGSVLIALLFGGNFIAGTEEQMTPYARGLARAFGAVVVNIKYRLAPQHPFPTQQLDAFEGVKWIASHAEELKADPSQGFIVGGVSAGGNCAAVLARMAQEEKLAHPLTGQWLSISTLLDSETVPEKYKAHFISRAQNAKGPLLDQATLAASRNFTEWDPASPLRNPSLSKAPLSELPPAFFQVCGMDPLRDDGLIYEVMLKEAGVKTRMDFYPGCPHGHWTSYPGLDVSRKGYADVMMGIGWLLGRDITKEEGLKALAIPGM